MPWGPTLTNNAERAGYWDGQSLDADTTRTAAPAGGPQAWMLQNRFVRTTPTGTREDIAMVTMHIAKNPGAGVRTTGVTTELPALETILDVWWNVYASYMSSAYTLSEYRWFVVKANDPLTDKGYPMHGPPVRITGKALSGTQVTQRNTDQVSATVTFKSASRKHWGRIYLPGVHTGALNQTYGRLTNTFVDGVASGARVLVNSLAAASGGVYELGIWSPRGLAFLNTTVVQVDDIADIIRRRRPKQAAYFKRYTA